MAIPSLKIYVGVLRVGERLEDTANLPDSDVLAVEILEDLEAALEQVRKRAEELEDAE